MAVRYEEHPYTRIDCVWLCRGGSRRSVAALPPRGHTDEAGPCRVFVRLLIVCFYSSDGTHIASMLTLHLFTITVEYCNMLGRLPGPQRGRPLGRAPGRLSRIFLLPTAEPRARPHRVEQKPARHLLHRRHRVSDTHLYNRRSS